MAFHLATSNAYKAEVCCDWHVSARCIVSIYPHYPGVYWLREHLLEQSNRRESRPLDPKFLNY